MIKSMCEAILAIIILVFALWQTKWSDLIIAIAAIILLIHSFTCKKCFAKHMPASAAKPTRKR